MQGKTDADCLVGGTRYSEEGVETGTGIETCQPSDSGGAGDEGLNRKGRTRSTGTVVIRIALHPTGRVYVVS